jgi:hypothetical protein
VQALPGRAVLIGDVATVASPVVVGQSNSASGPPIAFFFPYGVAVLWGFTEVKRERERESRIVILILISSFVLFVSIRFFYLFFVSLFNPLAAVCCALYVFNLVLSPI